MSARTDRVAFEKNLPDQASYGSWLENDRSQKGCFMKRAIFLFAGASVALGSYPAAAFAQTLKAVKDRGSLICGVSQDCRDFPIPTTRATGPVSTSTSAARWPRRS